MVVVGRICGGGGAGYVAGEIKNKAKSAQLELEPGLSLAILGKFTFFLILRIKHNH